MLVRIPLYYYYTETDDSIDYESLGIEPPKDDVCHEDIVAHDTYVDPNAVVWIEPKIDGDGCYIHVKGMEKEWYSSLSVEEAVKIINEAII